MQKGYLYAITTSYMYTWKGTDLVQTTPPGVLFMFTKCLYVYDYKSHVPHHTYHIALHIHTMCSYIDMEYAIGTLCRWQVGM